MPLDVDRAQVLAYRIAASGLHRDGALEVLDLGVQDTPHGSARLALAARSAADANPDAAQPGRSASAEPRPLDQGLTLAWTMRGAPHVHHDAALPGLAAALWPGSEADALSKIAWQRSRVSAVGMGPVDALAAVATAMRRTVTAPMAKGAASAAVTAAAPASLSAWCRPCGSTHVFESLFRLAALPAGLRLEPDSARVVLAPIEGWPLGGPPREQAGVDELARTYLRFLGPAAPAQVAAYLNSTAAELRRWWPDDLAEVRVDGRRAWLPEPLVEALRTAPQPRLVRLLPPSDPYLQARDRDLVLPDKAAQRALWTALGQPGAVLLDGEIAGIWRPRTSGRSLRLAVTAFTPIPPDRHAELDAEAHRVATIRGATAVNLTIN
jgi:Winged helix DNA-binding domain